MFFVVVCWIISFRNDAFVIFLPCYDCSFPSDNMFVVHQASFSSNQLILTCR